MKPFKRGVVQSGLLSGRITDYRVGSLFIQPRREVVGGRANLCQGLAGPDKEEELSVGAASSLAGKRIFFL